MARRCLIAICCLGLLAAAAGRASPQTDRMAPGPPHETNLEIGQLPPSSFALRSAINGTLFDLEAQRGERPILLLFFRGTWWPFCRRQLGELHASIAEIRATGADFWAIANEDPDKLESYAQQEGFDFPLLIDVDGETIESWGLLNAFDHKGRRIPHPALVVLDRDGIVRDVHVETNYRLRSAAAEVVRNLERTLGSPGE